MIEPLHRVEKPWGYELWWARTDRYVGKQIHINKGHALSLQYHNKKDETIFVWSGKILFEREVDGKVTPMPYRAWQDTVNSKSGETVRLKMIQQFKGLRMFHCHVLEHEGAGMMGQLQVA